MTWFKVDDNLAFHPKTLMAGNAAMGLWVRAGSWSAQQLTDGVIPDSILPSLGTVKQAEALVRCGLWRRADGAWSFHEWNEDGRQPTRERVEADRAAAAERQRKHREGKGVSHRDTGVTHGVSHGYVTPSVTPTPTRPDPTRPTTPNGVVEVPPRKRGTRLPDGWTPSPESIARARADAPNVDHQAEHRVFVDYWIAQPGQRGVKENWDATWRNWMRKAQKDIRVPQGQVRRLTKTEQNLSVVAEYERREREQQMELEA